MRRSYEDNLEWIRNARIVSIDGYQPPLYPDRNYDADSIVDLARELDANVIRIAAMGKLAHFNTDQWEVDEHIKKHDFLQEIIYLAHESDIKVIPYVPGAVHLPYDLLMKWHPEWIQRAYPDQLPEDSLKTCHSGTLNGMVCPIGPYKDFYISMVKEVILNHEVDGWYSDAWKDCYFQEVCYCPFCREQFKKETGEDLYSLNFGTGGESFEKLKTWYRNKIIKMVQDIHAMVRKRKSLPTIINGIYGVLGAQSQGPWGKDIDEIHNALHFERKTDPYNRLVSASYLNVAGRKAWFYAGLYSPLQWNGPEGADENYADERKFPYRNELYNECFITFACGHAVNNIRVNSFFYDSESPGKAILKDIYNTVKNNPDVFEGVDYYPFVGVLNQETERHKFEGTLLKELVRYGIQATIFKETDIDNKMFLRKFPVLIIEQINEQLQLKLINDYVNNGGRLITFDDKMNTALLNAALLYENEKIMSYMSGRGIVVRVKPGFDANDLFEAVKYATEGYIPYRVEISSGELIPILSVKPGLWILHLINISRHFTETFDQGLETIPVINRVGIDVTLPDGKRVVNARLLRKGETIGFDVDGSAFKFSITDLEEYEAIVMKYN